MKKLSLLLTLSLLLYACGGGGGGNKESPSKPTEPVKSITLSLVTESVTAEEVTVSWTSTNATTCNRVVKNIGHDVNGLLNPLNVPFNLKNASDVELNGTLKEKFNWGQYQVTISCTNGNKTENRSVQFNIAMPVKSSSYENFKDIGLNSQDLPQYEFEMFTGGVAFADFFQDGTVSFMGASNDMHRVTLPNGDVMETEKGKIYFFHRDKNGKWEDRTKELISNRTGCISPRKAIVADFNGDKKPDVFISCSGVDYWPLPEGYSSGENPRFLMSRADGKYDNVDAGFKCYCHGASAAELNESGYADIVIVDPTIQGHPYVLRNNRGVFTKDVNAFDTSDKMDKHIWSVELIDFDGKGYYDAVLAGTLYPEIEVWLRDLGWGTTIHKNDGTGNFPSTDVVIPVDSVYNTPIDVVFDKTSNVLYLNSVDLYYSKTGIQKVYLNNLHSEIIYETNKFGSGWTHIIWMFAFGNNLVSFWDDDKFTIPL